ncbi:fumarylacetoacetate hydrolase family protein [Robertmurraya massiliosenegalensis]|uniref:fumarylacetoacetate hydrolase family protein n=1 Tax=Robertmurraya TaxID=2837507 RepID=UPI0039A770FA
MKLATVKYHEKEMGVIVTPSGLLPIETFNKFAKTKWETSIFSLIEKEQLLSLRDWFTTDLIQNEYLLQWDEVDCQPLYRHPKKIWGIGLNYVEHAADLSEKAPSTEPASFMKPDTTIIGPNDTIRIPFQSERTTAESELGIVIGKTCKDVEEVDASNFIAGFTTIIDMTAEDILQKNPRYLTRSKSFDTFFSFGPTLLTPDEVENVLELEVSTTINGNLHRKNKVSNMTFNPWYLVSFHSKVMTLLPGDIISTGTPGAVVIRDGDVVGCEIDGFDTLTNTVIDLKTK